MQILLLVLILTLAVVAGFHRSERRRIVDRLDYYL